MGYNFRFRILKFFEEVDYTDENLTNKMTNRIAKVKNEKE